MPNLGFEVPAAGGLLLLIPLLVWLYRRQHRPPQASVSSLVLWQQILSSTRTRRRLRLPFLLLLQIGLILALAGTLGHPYTREQVPLEPPRDVAVVIDRSASMQTIELGRSRFESARDAAGKVARLLTELTPERGLTLIATGVKPSIVARSVGLQELEKGLQSLDPIDVATNLTAAIELAASTLGPGGHIHVFTDEVEDTLTLSRDAAQGTVVHRFGTTDDNLGIIGLETQGNYFDQLSNAVVRVTVRNFSAEHRASTLSLRPLHVDGQASPDAGRTQAFEVGPGSTVTLEIRGALPIGSFLAQISPGGALALDDVAYGALAPRPPIRALLVSEDQGFQAEMAELVRRIGNIILMSSSVSNFESRTRAGSSDAPWWPRFDVVLFDRYVPAAAPPIAVAYLAPERGNPEVTTVGGKVEARVAEVRDHDLLFGIESPAALLSGPLVGLAASSAMQPILIGRGDQRELAIVTAGATSNGTGRGDRRIAATAFRIGQRSIFDPDALPQLFFILNLVRWLAPNPSLAPIQARAGESILDKLESTDRSLRLTPTTSTQVDAEPNLVKVGAFRVTTSRESRELLVSMLDPAESEIGRPPILSASSPPHSEVASASETLQVSRWRSVSHQKAVLTVLMVIVGCEAIASAWEWRRRRG